MIFPKKDTASRGVSKFFRVVFLGLVVLGLSQCQNLKGKQDIAEPQSWQEYVDARTVVKDWALDGRVGFAYYEDERRKAISARLDWLQEKEDFEITVSGPLGFGRIIVKKSGEVTELINHEGQVFRSSSPERLFYEQTRLSIPWSDLVWWVRGIPVPGKPFERTLMPDRQFQIQTLKQSDWQIDYQEYQPLSYEIGKKPEGPRLTLPTKIRFTNGDLSAKIIVRDWGIRD